jgi:hypothetical protein
VTMDEGRTQKGNDDDKESGGEKPVTAQSQQQPQTGDSNRGSIEEQGYYYHQNFAPIPYGYHVADVQWAAHDHSLQQHGYQYHPTYG